MDNKIQYLSNKTREFLFDIRPKLLFPTNAQHHWYLISGVQF